MDALGWHKDAREVQSVDHFLILNRNDNLIPGVARLNREQAALYFMLGETRGTSAGGKEEAGKFLRVPGTNPFFPLRHEQQGNRFLELMDSSNFQVYLLNTGRVGGTDDDERGKKVSIPYSSAIVKAISEGNDRVGAGSRLRLRGRVVAPRSRRPGDPSAPQAVRAPGPRGRVPSAGREAQGGPPRVPRHLPRPAPGDRQRRRVSH